MQLQPMVPNYWREAKVLMGKILPLCLYFHFKKRWTQLCSWSRIETRELFWRVFLGILFWRVFCMLLLICSNGEWLCANLAHASSSSFLTWVFWPFQCLDIAKILSTLYHCWNTASFKWNIYVYCSSLAFWIIYQYTFILTREKISESTFFSFF